MALKTNEAQDCTKAGSRAGTGEAHPEGEPEFFKARGLTSDQLRQAVVHTRQKLATSERRTCRVTGVARSTQQYKPIQHDDDEALRLAVVRLAKQYGRYGHRHIHVLLRREGWEANP